MDKFIMDNLAKALELLQNENMTSNDLETAIECVKSAHKDLEYYVDKSITWSIEDFEQRAIECEEFAAKINKTAVEPIYDRTKFKEACESMIREHDASLGITWDTIDIYLDEHCLLKNKES